MIKTFICILLYLSFALNVIAQPLQPVAPEKEGFSQERLQRIDTLLNGYIQRSKIAGVDALIVRHGNIVYHKAFGYKDVTEKVSLQSNDMFRIASQTKAVATIGLMILFEEGKFLLEDPVSKYIPEFKNPGVLKTFNPLDSSYTTEPAKNEITIRHLITHTSGIDYPVIGSEEAKAIYGKAGISAGFEPRARKLADQVKILATMPLMHNPGEKWTYGLGIDVVGYLIEVLSGQSLNDFLQQRLFVPLGMKDTYFYVPEEKQNRVAHTYFLDNGKLTNTISDSTAINNYYPFSKNASYYSGGAGLTSTSYDYALFLQMILNKGSLNGNTILSPSTVKIISTNQIGDLSLWGGNKMGLGFSIAQPSEMKNLPLNTGSLAWGGYWGSEYWVDPEAGLVVQIWSQSGLADLNNKFKIMVYAAMTEQ